MDNNLSRHESLYLGANDFLIMLTFKCDKTSFGLTTSLPEEESEHAEDDDEWC